MAANVKINAERKEWSVNGDNGWLKTGWDLCLSAFPCGSCAPKTKPTLSRQAIPVVGRVVENPTSTPMRFVGISYRSTHRSFQTFHDSDRTQNQKIILINQCPTQRPANQSARSCKPALRAPDLRQSTHPVTFGCANLYGVLNHLFGNHVNRGQSQNYRRTTHNEELERRTYLHSRRSWLKS